MQQKVSTSSRTPLSKDAKLLSLVVIGSVLIVLLMLYSILQGPSNISIVTLNEVIFRFDSTDKLHLILRDIRLPRVIASALIGSALAVAGGIMQGITRNPLADSGLLGINAGASFALAVSLAFNPKASYIQNVLSCFIGAGFGAILVNSIAVAGKKVATPLRLVLSGLAVSTLLNALSQGIALVFNMSQDIMFWTVGGISASTWQQIRIMLPIILTALTFAIFMSHKINLLSLGEDVARGLGLNPAYVYISCSILVALLAGISVSIVGSIGFVGLIVPHMARYIVGINYRHIIPASLVLGSLLMVLADLLARTINQPFETPLGALISVVGVPFFLYLARKERRAL